MLKTPLAETVTFVARAIADCDFDVTIQQFMWNNYPWIVTVGERTWQRHIVVEAVTDDGSDATLAILSVEESQHFGRGINLSKVDCRISLKELLSDKYVSVKSALRPPAEAN